MPRDMPESCQSACTASPHSAVDSERTAQLLLNLAFEPFSRPFPAGPLATPLTTHSNGTTNSPTGHGCPELLFHGLAAVAMNGLDHEGLDGAGTLVLHALDYQPPQAQHEPIGLLPVIDPPEQLRQWHSY